MQFLYFSLGMACSALADAPPEVSLSIFQACQSFQQVAALARTCRRMHDIWFTHASVIIWRVAPKVIPGFDQRSQQSNQSNPCFRIELN
ncbi:hypothetical protein N658DRAFT_220254 [Parathielavia hyrcaniae]|uniref:F-box domain-containing protein n=1 Tax=Parathielavia hyrcaniae TaxID=113614 RepID=A0AAN6PV18_9PEZI|nr:hypothetical protein N658DRAFT_220254 [Parathielavia hyrcaniae]